MQWRQRYNINMNARGWLLNVALIIISLSSIICWYLCNCLSYVTIVVVSIICCVHCDFLSLQLHHRIWSSSYQQMILLHRYHNYYAMSILLLRCISYHRKHHRLSVEPLSTTTTITLQYMSNFANHIIIVIMFVYAHTSSRQIMIWR
jgi:hypothetical protein